MKQLSKLLLILILLFSFNTVKAGEKYFVCQYTYKIKSEYHKLVGCGFLCLKNKPFNETSKQYSLDIKYEVGVGYYYNAPDGCTGIKYECEDASKRHDIGTSKNSLDSKLVFGDTSVFAEGRCPETVYVDLQGISTNGSASEVEICMGDYDDCKEEDGGGHKFVDYGVVQGGQDLTVNLIEITKTYQITDQKKIIKNTVETSLTEAFKVDESKKLREGTLCDVIYIDAEGKISKTIQESALETLTTTIGATYDAKKEDAINANSETHAELINWFKITEEEKKSYIEGLVNNINTSCLVVSENSRVDLTVEEQAALDGAQEAVDKAVDLVIQKYFDATVDLGGFNGDESCEGFLGDPDNGPNGTTSGSPAYYLKFTLNLIKYAGIAATFIFSLIDFLKAITSQDKDLLQKAIKSSTQRLILAIVIFFLPILIDFILELFGAYGSCIK